MPFINSATKFFLKPIPRFISPKAHAVIDYATAASFLVAAIGLSRRSKRAAIGALVCGGAYAIVNMMTDYPGGVRKEIPYRIHADIDLGLAAMIATMPEFLAFKDDEERKFFLVQGALITAVHQLTDFPHEPSFVERALAQRRAA